MTTDCFTVTYQLGLISAPHPVSSNIGIVCFQNKFTPNYIFIIETDKISGFNQSFFFTK